MGKMLTVATDGSCLKNPGGAIGWAWADENGRWQANGYHTGTNQRAELLGLLSVLRSFSNQDLHIQLDSQYSLNIAETWVWGWAKANWQRKKPLSNLDIVKVLHAELVDRRNRGIKTEYEWVKGHVGNALNEVADVRAGEASAKAKQKQPSYADSVGNISSERQQKMLDEVYK